MNRVYKKIIMLIKSKEFQKFFIVGLSAFIVDFSLLNFQLYILNFNSFLFDFISVPNLISSVTSILFNYFLQRNWAFKSKNTHVINESLRFFSVHGFNLVIFNGLLFGFIVQLGVAQPITKIFVTAVQLFVSFILYKLFVFKSKN